MKNILSCEYSEKYSDLYSRNYHNHYNSIKIIQTLADNEEIIVNGKDYPVMPEALYFTGSTKTYSLIPDEKEKYFQNSVVISKIFLDSLSELLNFKKETEKIFDNRDIYFFPVKYYKAVNSRSKKIPGAYNLEYNLF